MGTDCLSLPEILFGPSHSHAPSAADPSQRHCAHTSLHSGGSPLPAGYKAHLRWHNSQIWYPKKRTVCTGSSNLSSDHNSSSLACPSSTYQGQHTRLSSWGRSHNTGREQHIQMYCAAPVWRLARCCLTAHFPLTHTFDAVQCPFYMHCGPEWLSHFH